VSFGGISGSACGVVVGLLESLVGIDRQAVVTDSQRVDKIR
jgi:hypothetical protein